MSSTLLKKLGKKYGITASYYESEIRPIIQSAKDSEYAATIVISHDGKKTKHLNMPVAVLEKLVKLLEKADSGKDEGEGKAVRKK